MKYTMRSLYVLFLIVLTGVSLWAQATAYKIPVTLIDSFYNVSDNSLRKVKTSTLTFGVHPDGTRCGDFPNLKGFQTHWYLNDLDTAYEYSPGAEPPTGERYVWDLFGCSDGQIFPDNIRGYFMTAQIDTYKIDIRFENDASAYHHRTLVWPSVLAEYFDACMLIKNFGTGSPTTLADMRMVSSFTIPPPSDVSLFIRYTIYVHGIKPLPGYPAALDAVTPADGDTGVSTTPRISWITPPQGAWYYGLQISTSPLFISFIFNDTLSTPSKLLSALLDNQTYYWRVYAQNQYGASYYQNPPFHFTTTTVSDVKPIKPPKPMRFSLSQNFPNPFNPTTHLQFTNSKLQLVSLKIYDVRGREVATIVNEELLPGNYSRIWNATTIPSGVYFYKLRAEKFSDTKKMLLMK